MSNEDEIIELVNTDYTWSEGRYWSYDGVLIKTNKQEIKLGIENGQSCCESWGYIVTNDIVGEFVGAKVLNVVVTDNELMTAELKELKKDTDCCMTFFTVKTDRGDFQFTAYNSHNGYYSHTVKIISNQLTTSDSV